MNRSSSRHAMPTPICRSARKDPPDARCFDSYLQATARYPQAPRISVRVFENRVFALNRLRSLPTRHILQKTSSTSYRQSLASGSVVEAWVSLERAGSGTILRGFKHAGFRRVGCRNVKLNGGLRHFADGEAVSLMLASSPFSHRISHERARSFRWS